MVVGPAVGMGSMLAALLVCKGRLFSIAMVTWRGTDEAFLLGLFGERNVSAFLVYGSDTESVPLRRLLDG